MNVSISTSILQRLVTKVQKGASNNKLLALTSLVYIELKNKVLKLTTTDMTNYVTATEYNVDGSDFEVVIDLESFAKLVGRTTTQTISLELTNNSLRFVGNGTYNIELPLNEEGVPIKFPMYEFNPVGTPTTIKYADIKSVINANKSCLSSDMTQPLLTYYYCGNNVITADQLNICINSLKLFEEPVLISNVMMDLISLFGDDEIVVTKNDNSIKFSSKTFCVYGKLFTQVEDYPAEPIEAYLTEPFKYNCYVSKELLLGAIGRLSIFMDKLDGGKLIFEFGINNVVIYNNNKSSSEVIPYQKSTDVNTVGNFTCYINSELISNQLSSNTDDNLHIYYANESESCIKLVDNNIVKITSLMEE